MNKKTQKRRPANRNRAQRAASVRTTRRISELMPDDMNANRGTDRGRGTLSHSIKEFGTGRSVVIDRAGRIIAGNKTVESAIASGITEMVVVPSDGKKLIAVQRTDLDLQRDPSARGLAIADNRTGELNLEWDGEVLGKLEMNLQPFFTDQELADLTGKPGAAADAAPDARVDEAAELQKQWQTAAGQTWEIPSRNLPGRFHRIMCGDATDLGQVRELVAGEPVDLLNTDPPYGVDYNSASGATIANDASAGNKLVKLLLGAFKAAAANSRPDAAFYIWHASSTRREFECAMDAAGLREKQYIVWVKDSFVLGHADYHWQSEPCFYAEKSGQSASFYGDRTGNTVWRLQPTTKGALSYAIANGIRLFTASGRELFLQAAPAKSKSAKIRMVRVPEGGQVEISTDDGSTDAWSVSHQKSGMLHPNQKPPALALRAIENSTLAGGLVLDLFGGSGFTMIGAELAGRRSATMELDPKFVAVELQRMADMGMKPRLVALASAGE